MQREFWPLNRSDRFTEWGYLSGGSEWDDEVPRHTRVCFELNLIGESGGQRRDRTADAGLFRAALYH